MTKQRINDYIALRKELAEAEAMQEALRSAAEPGAQVLTGMPHTPGYADRIGDLAAEIADISSTIEALQGRISCFDTEIQTFIETIPDNFTRMIFRLRLFHVLSWGEIATVLGGRNTASGAYSIYYRYIKKHCS